MRPSNSRQPKLAGPHALRRLAVALALSLAMLLLLGLLALLAAGEVLSRPTQRSPIAAPADLAVRVVRIDRIGEPSVAGWFIDGRPGRGAVLLLHGVHADRRQMLARARLLAEAGHASLLIDLPGHGESPADRLGFGGREAGAVVAALAWLRHERPGERVGIIGVSLGAAATVLAGARPAPAAVVLEALYPTIEEAVTNRLALRLGPTLGPLLAPALLWQLPWRTGVRAEELRPIERIAALGSPVLIAAGAGDRHTTWPETERLFEAAAPPKQLWRVEGAAHVDLQAHDPAGYRQRVLPFLARHLRAG